MRNRNRRMSETSQRSDRDIVSHDRGSEPEYTGSSLISSCSVPSSIRETIESYISHLEPTPECS